MSERDELADILMADELIWGTAGQSGRDYALSEADAILAAGYRKPRTITTAEELDALPVQSVIRHSNTALHEKWASGWRRLDSWEMTTGPVTPELPAIVLWEPR